MSGRLDRAARPARHRRPARRRRVRRPAALGVRSAARGHGRRQRDPPRAGRAVRRRGRQPRARRQRRRRGPSRATATTSRRSCSAPTSRCTRPRRARRGVERYSVAAGRLEPRPPRARRRPAPRARERASSCPTSSRRSTCATARSSAPRRCCAGTTRRGRSVSPDVFIPLAEQTGLIVPVTLQVISAAIRECSALARPRPRRPVRRGQPLRPRPRRPELPAHVEELCRCWDLPTRALVPRDHREHDRRRPGPDPADRRAPRRPRRPPVDRRLRHRLLVARVPARCCRSPR